MKFDKPALSVDQQLDLLIRRGMAVADRPAALNHLTHINYYRLRAYWLLSEIPVATDGDHGFRPGTHFESIIDLYSFDRKLRLLVMDAIERVEVSLRTRWANFLANRYGAHAYMDSRHFRKPTQHAKCLTKLQEELERSRETFILHYRSKYSEPELPPLWSICELLTFGQLSQWYGNLAKGADRAEIAKAYEIDEQVLGSFAHHLAYVRNVCAHHMRLWNREMTISMKIPKNPESLSKVFHHEAPKRLYNTLAMLAHLMDGISPGSQWRHHLLSLFSEHPSVDVTAMGFPLDWRTLTIWK